jgi:DNA-binding HxlR family transcriptional regulator
MNRVETLDKMRHCPVTTTVQVIGGKWKPRLLWLLRRGTTTFGALRRGVRASDRMVSRSLKDLERAGVILREERSVGRVVTTRYAFTTYGRTLIPVLDAMGHWGVAHQRGASPHDETAPVRPRGRRKFLIAAED